MSVRETLLQITVAALAVIGFYGVLHGLFEALLMPRELAVAVIITRPVSPEELDILLCEARRAPLGRRKRVVLALPRDLWETRAEGEGEYAEVIDKYGATVCLLDATST